MRIFRTPETRFSDLKDYPFQPHYITLNNIQIHYLDEGPENAIPVLLLHGVPAWSYLYRHIIKIIAEAGYRVIAPDLIGFGKSDKPRKIKYYNYQIQIDCISNLIKALKLQNIILFGHDWGSLIGLRIAGQDSQLFSAIIICNGMLPTGEQKIHYKLKLWQIFARYSPFIPVNLIIGSGIIRKLDKEEKRAYSAPFPSSKYKVGIRAMPAIVPTSPTDPESKANKIAWQSLVRWEKPFLTLFSTRDPITRGGDEYLLQRIPGAKQHNHKRLDAKHFIQEDRSIEIANIIIKFSEETVNEFNKNHKHELEMPV